MQHRKLPDADLGFASIISKRYRSQSRRSFLSRITKASFGILGVFIAGEAPLFVVPEATASGNPWQWCGLHGYVCLTGCTAGSNPPQSQRWVACCPDTTACHLYHCCFYTDACGSGTGCTSSGLGTPPSGQPWCGPGSTGSGYVCTIVSCGGTGYQSSGDCLENCAGLNEGP
jgi:hypothetical protein